MSRQIVATRPGGPEVLKWQEAVSRPLEPGEMRVRVEAIGVNRADILVREGNYHQVKFPAVPGFEAAGVVTETKSSRWEKDKRVLIFRSSEGLYSEEAIVREADVVEVPDSVSSVDAASIPINWLTAYELLVRRAGLCKGERVLVTAGASGVGQAAIQIASQIVGAKGVVATASSDAKVKAITEAYGCQGLVATAETLTTALDNWNNGFEVVLDLVGGKMFRPCLLVAAPGGRVCQAANVTLEDSTMNVRDFYPRNLTIFGFQYGNALKIGKHHFGDDLAKILENFRTGVYRSTVRQTFALEDAASAHRMLVERNNIGKLILKTGSAI